MAKKKMEDDEFDALKSNLEADSALGKEVQRQFRHALMHRNHTQVGEYKLSELLRECYDARDYRASCEELTMRSRYPGWAVMPVSIVSFKVSILVAMIRGNLASSETAPFTAEKTDIVELPAKIKKKYVASVVEEIRKEHEVMEQQRAELAKQLLAQGLTSDEVEAQLPRMSEDDLIERVRQAKIKGKIDSEQHADEEALRIQEYMYDKTADGKYYKAALGFIDDLATFPFAVMHGPTPTQSIEPKWSGSKFIEEKKVIWSFERISPFDFFWTEDCTNPQDGAAVFIRKRVPYTFLYSAYEMAKNSEDSGYRKDELKEVMEKVSSGEGYLPLRWTDLFSTKNPEDAGKITLWRSGDSIEILIRYGRFTGAELSEMGLEGVPTDEASKLKPYETKIVMVGDTIIQCQLNENPSNDKRPVHVASFESRNGTMVGVGMAQKLLPLHKAYRAVWQLAMYNLGLSSEPITEVEAERLLQYMPDDWIEEPSIVPGQVFPTDGDRKGTGSRAIKFTDIPNQTATSLNMASRIFDLAHTISNIPAALHGQPVGSGANRTVRGLLTLQGNTLKPIDSALTNVDVDVIQPMFTLLYRLLLKHDNDFNYTGDAKIVPKGAAGAIRREVEKQEAMEQLQILGQFGNETNPDLLERAKYNVLTKAGMLEPGEKVSASSNSSVNARALASLQQAPPQQGALPELPPLPTQ